VSDRSTNTNRHGIPTLGGTAKPCCWPGCIFGADRNLQLPMCRGHARHTHTAFATVLNREQADLDARIAAQRQEAVKERELHAVIYYAKIGGHIKIGWTSRLDQRMRAYPPNTELLAVHPGTRADEKKLHHRSGGPGCLWMWTLPAATSVSSPKRCGVSGTGNAEPSSRR
jgi:hypothetical protein